MAKLGDGLLAQSEAVLEVDGSHDFPRSAVRMEWLEPSPPTAEDLECPHGVRFSDVVLPGARHSRVAWSYEAPGPSLARIRGRIGFWQEVSVG